MGRRAWRGVHSAARVASWCAVRSCDCQQWAARGAAALCDQPSDGDHQLHPAAGAKPAVADSSYPPHRVAEERENETAHD